jgi:hypothetical protein
VPAAAVIPAPIAYIKVVAVKKLVVGCDGEGDGVRECTGPGAMKGEAQRCGGTRVTVKKLECLKQANA